MRLLRRRWLVGALVAVLLAHAGVWLGLLWVGSTYERPYDRVEDGLYIGASVDKPPRGTQAVVNLCGRPDPYQAEASLWEPVLEDETEPDLGWLRRVVGFIAEQRKAGRTTYVHCSAGMNRSGAAVTAYLMQEHGWDREQALGFLRSKRSEVQPNPTLMRLLAEWEQELKAKPDAAPNRTSTDGRTD
jgi:hypothetical protein